MEPLKSYKLSPEQIKYYNDNGFLVIKQLVDFSSLYSFKQRFIQVCKGIVPKGVIFIAREPSLVGKKTDPEDNVNKIQEILFDDVFFQYAQYPPLLDIIQQLIGKDVMGIHSMFINKPPGTGRHPPHQDLFYFPFRPADKIVASWTAVDHVTTENGCLYVIPGSHKKEVLYEHGHLEEFTKLYHGILLEKEVAPEEKRVNLEMSPGDTVFFHPYLIHGSRPNVSKNYRKSVTFHFANSTSCYSIDVSDTLQKDMAQEVVDEAKRKGFSLTFTEIWKYKSRQVTEPSQQSKL